MISYAPLRKILNEKDLLSLKQFEQTLGLSSDVYYKIDRDDPLLLSTIETLCIAFNQPIEKLVIILNNEGNSFNSADIVETDSIVIDQKTVQNVKINKLDKELRDLKVYTAQLEARIAADRIEVSKDLESSTLGQRIEFKRQEKGLSVSELANLISSAPATIYKLEDGTSTNPTLQNLIRISAALGCSLNWLATGIE